MTVKLNLPKYIEPPIRAKLEEVIEAVTPHLPESPEEVFVSTKVGEPRVPSLWLFTKYLVVEIRGPLNRERIQFDCGRLYKAVDWIRLKALKYDFGNPKEDSVLEVEFTTIDGLTSELSATGKGCARLMDVYRDRLIGNFKTPRSCPDDT